MRHIINNCSMLLVLAVLSACGGGGGGGGQAVTNQAPGGIWTGTVTSVEDGSTVQAVGVITEAGEVRFITSDGEQTVGSVSTNGTSFTSTLTSYAPLGSTFNANGQSTISGTATGTLQERSTFSGTASYAGSASSTFSFTYEPIHNRASSLATIAGTYSESDGAGYTETYSIDQQGTFTGSDTDGCQLLGTVTILDAQYNIYRITFAATSCGVLDGNYTGLTLLDDDVSTNDTLVLSVSGTTYVISGTVPRV